MPVAALALLVACTDTLNPTGSAIKSPEKVDKAVETSAAAAAQTTYLNLAYATRSPAEKLDIYLPSTGVGPYPVVLWIHGGGWSSGDKYLATGSAQFQVLAQGIALASINYRLSGQAIFPAQIHDVKAAVRWLRANATRYKLNGARMGAWGASAGAHLASLLGTSAGTARLTDRTLGNPYQPENVKAVVDFSGPTNFLLLDAQLARLGCGLYAGIGFNAPTSPTSRLMGAPIQTIPAKVAAANPETYITTNDPPFLIEHGSADCTVPYTQSANFRSRLATVIGPGKVTYKLFIGAHHSDGPFFTHGNGALVASWLKAQL